MQSQTVLGGVDQPTQDQGFYHGRIDEIIGLETEQAIGQFQQRNGLSQTATLDQPTMDKLLGSSVGSQRSSGPTVFHGTGATAKSAAYRVRRQHAEAITANERSFERRRRP
jgi:peptidoglycan hydrolase-like protein with peptidoglycan-binding domain